MDGIQTDLDRVRMNWLEFENVDDTEAHLCHCDARLSYKRKLGTALATADEQTFQNLRRMCLGGRDI